ncbi:hypothetical protein [Endozoicomonas arenosclerae]|uniref:hypothetical protein n=1 Tax=Endozoicomonas arenosclerae TaxID=1633495 RepID=UPI000780DB4B|nr:hypothetical protein [Endozoicomonas arenosclerae]
MKKVTDERAANLILGVVLLISVVSYLFDGFVVPNISPFLSKVIPGIEAFSTSTKYYVEAKSLWSLQWFLFPFLLVFIVFVSFLGQTKAKINIFSFFVFILFFVFCFYFAYTGLNFETGSEKAVGKLSKLYASSYFGVYLLSGAVWVGIYSMLFLSCRVLRSLIKN